jgi:hypothetical protein
VRVDAKIQKLGKDAIGKDCPEGYYAVRPSKQIVLMPPTATKLKDGYRLATQQDLEGPSAISLAELRDIHDDDLPPDPPKAA